MTSERRIEGPALPGSGSRARALGELVFTAIDGGTRGVEAVHAAIARRPFDALALAPVARVPAGAVRVLHDAITTGVYATIRVVNALAGGAAVAVLGAYAARRPPRPPSRRRDLAIAALNGAIGDRLERERSALGARMEFRHRGRPLSLDRESLARVHAPPGRRLAVFVHGLMGDEHVWRFHSAEHYGNRHTTYGSRLRADLGHAPLYLRYNTGLHVSENGRRLAALLDELVGAWPVEVEELVLVGHSMGGLVARSACHYGEAEGRTWVRTVRHVVCLGAPHRGAPLEKLANVAGWLLLTVDVTRPLGEIVNGRSAGIKDLRFGYLLDDDWRGRDPDALLGDRARDVPLLASAVHYFLAGTLTRDRRHPVAAVLGDALVRLPSAAGRGWSGRRVRHFGPMTHLRLLNDPAVYEQMRRWLSA